MGQMMSPCRATNAWLLIRIFEKEVSETPIGLITQYNVSSRSGRDNATTTCLQGEDVANRGSGGRHWFSPRPELRPQERLSHKKRKTCNQ